MMDFMHSVYAKAAAADLGSSLGEILDAGIKAIEAKAVTFSVNPLFISFYYMRTHEMISSETFEYLRPLFQHANWRAEEFLEDGSIEYLPADGATDKNMFVDYSMKMKPGWMRDFFVSIMRSDKMTHECLCTDSYEELIASMDGYQIEAPLIRTLVVEPIEKILVGDSLIVNGLYFYFLRDEHEDTVLCVKRVNEIERLSSRGMDCEVRRGMQGTILHYGNHLYFPVKNANAYLNVDVRDGSQEILSNIHVIGCRNNENLVYVNYLTDKVCYDQNGAERVICDYDGNCRYTAKDEYVLVSASFWTPFFFSFRVTYDGVSTEASSEETAKAFWRAFFYHNTWVNFGSYKDMNESMHIFQLNVLISNQAICVENFTKILTLIMSMGKWRSGKVFPITGILTTLLRAGVNPRADVTREMCNMAIYARKVLKLPKENCVFSPIFYFIVYKHSKEGDFLSLLRSAPQKLFQSDIISDEERERIQKEISDKTGISEYSAFVTEACSSGCDNIGLFDIDERKVKAFIISMKKGVYEDTRITCAAPQKEYRGSVYYDIVKGKYIIDWPEQNDELKEVVCKVFNHQDWEVKWKTESMERNFDTWMEEAVTNEG